MVLLLISNISRQYRTQVQLRNIVISKEKVTFEKAFETCESLYKGILATSLNIFHWRKIKKEIALSKGELIITFPKSDFHSFNIFCSISRVVDTYLFIFFALFIQLTLIKASKALYMEQLSSNYPDLLPKVPRYCFSVEIFYLFFFSFCKRYD